MILNQDDRTRNLPSNQTQAMAWISGLFCVLVLIFLNVELAFGAQQVPPDSLEAAKMRVAKALDREDADFLLIAESSMVKVMPDRAPFKGRPGEALEIAVAGGETEAGQIIIAPINQGLRDVTFSVSDFVGPNGATLAQGSVSLDVVGYIRTVERKMVYEVDRVGWFPEPILTSLERFDVERDRVQSLWLSVQVAPGQAPGLYVGTVSVDPENAAPETIAVNLRVFDFSIPRAGSYPLSIATFVDNLKRMHGDQWSDDLYWKYADFILEHRLYFDNTFRDAGPAPSVEEIKRLVAGGQQLWALRFIRQPGEGFSDVGPELSEYPAYLDEAFEEANARLRVLEEAGARDLAYIYIFDEVKERHFETLLSVGRRIKKELPGVPIWTSAQDKEFGRISGLDEVIDVWGVNIMAFDDPEWLANIEQARANGAEIVWYLTPWPFRPFANFLLEYDAIEPRLLMGAMIQKIQPDGFGYWSTNWWANQHSPLPRGAGPYTDWSIAHPNELSNGDGNWIMAGEDGPITTIRFENVRDGLEDYEYYQLLARAVERGERQGAAPELLARARALLQVPDDVVRGLTDFTRDPRVLEQHRLEVAEAIEQLAGNGGR